MYVYICIREHNHTNKYSMLNRQLAMIAAIENIIFGDISYTTNYSAGGPSKETFLPKVTRLSREMKHDSAWNCGRFGF